MKYDGTNPIILTQFRYKIGLTQKELAYKWKVSTRTIISWENGRRRPATDMMLAYINEQMEKQV